jgi:hypothetical protein
MNEDLFHLPPDPDPGCPKTCGSGSGTMVEDMDVLPEGMEVFRSLKVFRGDLLSIFYTLWSTKNFIRDSAYGWIRIRIE